MKGKILALVLHHNKVSNKNYKYTKIFVIAKKVILEGLEERNRLAYVKKKKKKKKHR